MNYARIIIGIYGIKKVVLNNNIQKQTGFTLIEILIVVILLGIMATIIIPQVSVSSDDAKVNSLKTNLNIIRSAIELYYHQHGNMYPGYIRLSGGALEKKNGLYCSNQLTHYTSIDGVVSNIKDDTYKFGPYVSKGALPINPYKNDNRIKLNATKDDITDRAITNIDKGWKFYSKLGIFFANDEDHFNL